ncbi:hypothetical protein BE17_37120 [Sorangium cellulosum]|uniref:Uncharacterized protein n=1 Tax=Sorangium cellulosum TaxID=56 RepID=A0A150RDM7_SORCE|nr:hypothetical protein BE17_37120 [Sorangium cellulosum]
MRAHFSWYSKQHLDLLQEMEKVDMGGRSLPDESVVFFGSETFSGAWPVCGPRGGRCYLGGQERGAME